jgi:hypothetical protein
MKKLFTLSMVMLITLSVLAQAPQKMSYQAVIRNSSNALVTSSPVGMRVSILQGTTPVYVETHATNTNANGLVTIEIGGGTFVSGVAFSAIDWSAGTYYIKTETDPNGGTNYTAIVGTSQLLSVPYALYSKTVASYPETDPTVKAINGIVKSNGTTISAATAGTDYLTPTGSAASLTNFPILNQNTTGNAATVTTNANLTGMVTSVGNVTTVVTNANLTGDVISTGNATTIANKITITATAPVSITGSPTVIASGAVAISIAAATPSTAGSMSAADKTKLDGIAPPTHIIGESYGGGIIFYLDASGKHGLIAATTDQSISIQWYNGTFTNTTAFASSVGGGDGNTSMIVFNQGTGTYAAQLCYDLNTGGFTDWYLPSKYELNLMYQNIGQGNLLGLGNVGGFANDYYWSSTEGYSGSAWFQFFANGDQSNLSKDAYNDVRAIRAF